MGWLDFIRAAAGSSTETLSLPLFPLDTVLFPGGVLGLKIFEQRYLDMVADCIKAEQAFGIALIASGAETGSAAQPHPVGTLARITRWEMEQSGILLISVRGDRRFRIIKAEAGADNRLTATAQLLGEPQPTAVPPERQRLLPFLRRVISDLGPERCPPPHAFDEAAWVGYRISEALPIQNLAKQKLLELDDPLIRLEILETWLDQKKLLG
ncbi:MAG: LON peptidase substrate-binding domain-containing protein [Azonexus sp.]|jgi:Lon protease-like protein|nr:LON peptidase substrate-binding domain-containing protein [Azonexus sp.]